MEEYKIIQAMKIHGGGFVKKLAELYDYADEVNKQRIRLTWPDYWADYEKMAKRIEEREEGR